LAKVQILQEAEDEIASCSPTDQELVRRAVRLLAHDGNRARLKIDYNLVEDGERLWGFVMFNISLTFIEGPGNDITVIHVTPLSHFGFMKGPQ
jgi:hypothetical protein